MSLEILLVLLLFNIKHLLGDFVFQNTYVALGKGVSGWRFVKLLNLHCLVHVVISTGIVCLLLGTEFLWFVPLEFVVHLIINRLKSGSYYGGQFSMQEHLQQNDCILC